MDSEALQKYIEFQLSELRSDSAHHEFERLCRYVVKRRICDRILAPAGPVSQGGDQGRDFETYRSYLPTNEDTRYFIGLAEKADLVFACTLQREGLKTKFLGDLEAIVSRGPLPDTVYFLCVVALSQSVVHEIQDAAKHKFGIHVEVIGRKALADFLSEPDLFWVAMKFLGVPSELLPQPVVSKERAEYRASLQRHLETRHEALTFGRLLELREGIREACEREATSDIPLWSGMLRDFLTCPPQFSEREQALAFYEIAVAEFRGLGTWDEVIGDLDAYFRAASEDEALDALDNAVNLVHFAYGTIVEGIDAVAEEAVDAWHDVLHDRLRHLLETASTPNRKCMLLELLGAMALGGDGGTPAEAARHALAQWLSLARLAPQAPLYPVKRLAMRLEVIAEFVCDLPEYTELTSLVDEILASRGGRAVAAESRRDRAFRLAKGGRLLDAVRELQHARADWLQGDTLRGAILAAGASATWLNELGLHYAAKYLALGAAYAAAESPHGGCVDLCGDALLQVGEADYLSGNWVAAYNEFCAGRTIAEQLGPAESGEPDHPANRALFYCVQIASLLPELPDAACERLTEVFSRNTLAWEAVAVHGVQVRANWRSYFEGRAAGSRPPELHGRPFGDTAVARSASWRAFGSRWLVWWANSLEGSLAGEAWCVSAQLLLCELADLRYDLLPLNVLVRIDVSSDSEFEINELRNVSEEWDVGYHIRLPLKGARKSGNPRIDHDVVFATAASVYARVALSANFMEDLERRFASGLSKRTFFAQSFDHLLDYWRFFDGWAVAATVPVCRTGFTVDESLFEHTSAGWPVGVSPRYSPEESLRLSTARYEGAVQATCVTLPRLLANEGILADLQALRAEGWLDWQILGAISALSMSYRAQLESGRDEAKMREVFARFTGRAESASDPEVPLKVFTGKALRHMLHGNMLSSLRVMGLQYRLPTVRDSAVRRFLSERYAFFEDDIPHPDFFGESRTS
jgi:hypothetical protein